MIRRTLTIATISLGLSVGLLANPASATHECSAKRDTPPSIGECKEAGHHDVPNGIAAAIAGAIAAAG